MCREILSSCVRNTEEAEKVSRSAHKTNPDREPRTNVWGMIEESKLAKTIRQEEAQKVHAA
jgi:protein phosphatase 1 regulatory subunit 37